MKKFFTILLIVIVLAELVFLGFRMINTCDDCEKGFFGLGYTGNIIDSAVNEEEQILCRECAEVHHALSLLAGKELDDFKRELVPNGWIPGEVNFGS